MTNEELKNMLFIIDTLLDDAITDSTRQKVKDTLAEVCKLAIQALEAQPSEDCISREEMLKYQQYLHGKMSNEENHKLWNFIKGLPSVTPRINLASTSQDCVSREAVIRLVEQYPNIIGNRCSGLISDIKHLPFVTPKYSDEEIDKAQAVEQAYVDKMVELTVEEIKRPKGHWIIIDDCELFMAKCSECGEIVDSRMINKYPYCHCGAYMGGEDETN